MKKEKQIGVRVGLPAYFALEWDWQEKEAATALRVSE
jgi:hypothetical protein